MANGMEIAGTGLVCWTFDTTMGVHLPVKTMAYYVPDATYWLCYRFRMFSSNQFNTASCQQSESYSGSEDTPSLAPSLWALELTCSPTNSEALAFCYC